MKEMNKDMENLLERAQLKKIPFSAPEGYFDSLEERLRERTFQTKPEKKWGAWKGVLKAGLTLAASFLIVAGLGWGVMKLTNMSQNRMAVNTDSYLTEEGNMMIDSLLNRFGAIEIADIYQNSLAQEYNDDYTETLSEEEYEALEEYISLVAPSYPGLLTDEIALNR